MASYTYRLPWPPSVNNYWGHNRRGFKHLTKRARAFREQVAFEALLPDGEPPTPLETRLRVLLELVPPTKHRCDIDNFCKSTIDAIMHAGIIKDDSQIDELIVRRMHVEPPGCCDVTITEVEA